MPNQAVVGTSLRVGPTPLTLGVIMTVRRGRHADPIDPAVRALLIAEAFRFIDTICPMPGIEKIALVGSLTTDKPDPKDADLLVTVADHLNLARRFQNRIQEA